jgi:hypothetical protein
MARGRPKLISVENIKLYLDETKDKHRGKDYDAIMEYRKIGKIGADRIGNLCGVNRNTAGTWINILDLIISIESEGK